MSSVLRDFITWAVLAIARDLFTVVGIMIAMLAMNVRLSLLTFTVLPLMVGVHDRLPKQARDNYRQVRAAISWVNSVLAENINGVRVVQAFSRQALNYAHFHDEVNRNNLDTNLQAARIAAGLPVRDRFPGHAGHGAGGLAGRRSRAGSEQVITPGVLVAFVLYIDRFFEPIRDLSQRYDTFQSTMAGGERIFGLLDTPVEVQDAPDASRDAGHPRARCASRMSLSITPTIPPRFCRISTCTSSRARRWRWSARPAPANPPWSSCSAASMIPIAGRSADRRLSTCAR